MRSEYSNPQLNARFACGSGGGSAGPTINDGRPVDGSAGQQPNGYPFWKRNLVIVWITQCMTVMGFSFVFPFIPLFVRELGIFDAPQAALWAGISGGAMGLALFVCGPFWGMLGDRYGRKKNLLRAVFCGAFFTGVTSFSADVYQLIVLRLFTGVGSGVFATSMALVASSSPKERIPFSVGALQSALFVGSTVGPLIGGLLAVTVGFRDAWLVAGATVAVAGSLVLVFAKEKFDQPQAAGFVFRHKAFADLLHLLASREIAPILAVIFVVHACPMLMFAVLPLLLDSLVPGSAASMTGLAFAILGITAAAASYCTGWLSVRVGLVQLLTISALAAGLFYLPIVVVTAVPLLYLLLGLGGIFQGVLHGSTSALLGLKIPKESQSVGFGALQSVSAAAFGLGPLIGGAIASMTGLRSVFLVQSLSLFGAAGLIVWLLGSQKSIKNPRT